MQTVPVELFYYVDTIARYLNLHVNIQADYNVYSKSFTISISTPLDLLGSIYVAVAVTALNTVTPHEATQIFLGLVELKNKVATSDKETRGNVQSIRLGD